MQMLVLQDSILHKLVDWNTLIDEMRSAFQEACEVPQRNHYTTSGDKGLLVMPAWGYRGYMGIKVVSLTPGNPSKGMPFVQGFYALFDQVSGAPLVQIDAGALTNYRTAAASALASDYLSKKDSSSMMMIGSGSLAPYLIAAHKSIRPIEDVLIWSRTFTNAEKLAGEVGGRAIDNIDQYISSVDLISCATPSTQPHVRGEKLIPGQHIDLVGGFTPEMREADDTAVKRSRVFIDTKGALAEAGDLIQPIRHGVLRESEIKGDLRKLVAQSVPGRTDKHEITMFKSTGHAIEDIATAVWLWEGARSRKK